MINCTEGTEQISPCGRNDRKITEGGGRKWAAASPPPIFSPYFSPKPQGHSE